MAKGNGGTRASTPSGMYGGYNIGGGDMTPDQFQSRFVDIIAGGDYPAGWGDLDQARRELALMEAGFTGLASDDAEDIMFEDKRDDILGLLADNIVSDSFGYTHDDNVTATIGYKDGTRRNFDAMSNDFDIGSAGKSSSRGMYNKAYRQMDRRNISFVIYSDSGNSRYYANGEDGMRRISEYTGYEKWTRGRGTRRRDYIQDDWI